MQLHQSINLIIEKLHIKMINSYNKEKYQNQYLIFIKDSLFLSLFHYTFFKLKIMI